MGHEQVIRAIRTLSGFNQRLGPNSSGRDTARALREEDVVVMMLQGNIPKGKIGLECE